MPRTAQSTGSILDAARHLIAMQGRPAATVEAIASHSGAPIGSIYYRFRSVDELIARTWLRAVRHSHDAVLAAAADRDDPIETAVAVALALYDFCLDQREEALVLASVRPADLGELADDLRSEIASVNDPIEPLMTELARGCLGRADHHTRHHLLLATVTCPTAPSAATSTDASAHTPLGASRLLPRSAPASHESG